MKLNKKLCIGCNKDFVIEYEEIGEGKYCQDCFNKEMEIWNKESGVFEE